MVPIIVDANSLYARCHFAALNDPEIDKIQGGAMISIRSMLATLNPFSQRLPEKATHLLFCFDGCAKRDKGRAKKTTEYVEGLKLAQTLLPLCFGGTVAYPQEEADDAVATAATRAFRNPEIQTIFVASGDKDLQQLVNEKISYYSLIEKSILPWTNLIHKWNVKHPSQIAVVLALLGDAGDAINGVDKWGVKKVKKVFEQVTEDMDLQAVAEHVAAHMSEEQLQQFSESLDLTLLRQDIPNIPEPGEIVVGGEKELAALGWQDLVVQIGILRENYYSAQVSQDLLD
jgi:5'-3' exonuclease